MIESFEPWATASAASFGGDTANVFVLREDADFLTGPALQAEARRVVSEALMFEAPLQAREPDLGRS